ncbi:hypothetical protein BJ170DRAFT_636005 [Xylariales sp. AK1849]|nr:hypothetical protein BJ170DRAFT_636005 [Xylariales sp. AK1849]
MSGVGMPSWRRGLARSPLITACPCRASRIHLEDPQLRGVVVPLHQSIILMDKGPGSGDIAVLGMISMDRGCVVVKFKERSPVHGRVQIGKRAHHPKAGYTLVFSLPSSPSVIHFRVYLSPSFHPLSVFPSFPALSLQFQFNNTFVCIQSLRNRLSLFQHIASCNRSFIRRQRVHPLRSDSESVNRLL